MADYLVTRQIRLSDEALQQTEFAELTPTARKILARSNFPYAQVLLNGSPEEVQALSVRLARRYFGVPTAAVDQAGQVAHQF